jgi:hypothetical protein
MAAGELQQLGAVFPVAGKQDDAAGPAGGQAAAVGGGELCAGDVDDEGACSVMGLPIVKLLFKSIAACAYSTSAGGYLA